MKHDSCIGVLGEDVARNGLWGQYRGFLEGLGTSVVGTRPVIKMRIFDFVFCAMDELVNRMARSGTSSAVRPSRRGEFASPLAPGAIQQRATHRRSKRGLLLCQV
jgi:pyruvate/2-oxoglutarate/acetoin dehydrogenase E1 component